jgi:hypothetical protein
VWESNDDLGGTIGTDYDILMALSTDNGATWTPPISLNTNAGSDTGFDSNPLITTDARGNWAVVWESFDTLGGTIGTDEDILVARFARPDCNGNGVGDGQDVANGTSADCNANGVPDECETNSDGDSKIDACDGCPNDANKIAPGRCGCGVPDTDSDGDGTPNCIDGCPNDPGKIAPGVCGCGVSDADSDGDGIPDCNDGCPTDPVKTAPGACGCGVADVDANANGVADCNDTLMVTPAAAGCGACGSGAPAGLSIAAAVLLVIQGHRRRR